MQELHKHAEFVVTKNSSIKEAIKIGSEIDK